MGPGCALDEFEDEHDTGKPKTGDEGPEIAHMGYGRLPGPYGPARERGDEQQVKERVRSGRGATEDACHRGSNDADYDKTRDEAAGDAQVSGDAGPTAGSGDTRGLGDLGAEAFEVADMGGDNVSDQPGREDEAGDRGAQAGEDEPLAPGRAGEESAE